ncbi:hypothetical protein QM012_009289 [Aureobasidium pullulans]|uniref:Uncharacterized protein n=1 Tax=Aureobasidium pullulans TaxID=5580 RepID=A0ABR0TGF1_AURPU
MYHHANTNINPVQSRDHDSKSTQSSEIRRRQIPLAFTNTEWGKEYAANPNWEHENLGRSNPTSRQGSRFRSEPELKTKKSASVSVPSQAASERQSANPPADMIPSASSKHPISTQEYSVMVAWNFFRRTFPHITSPTTPDTSTTEYRTSPYPQHEEEFGTGPWLEMLMRWDDFEQWRLKMLERPWYLPVTSEES